MHQRRRSEKIARWIAILYRRGAANAKKSALDGELLDETEREGQKTDHTRSVRRRKHDNLGENAA